jgi:tRNA (uracil-5-)-methyltransferase TRM9
MISLTWTGRPTCEGLRLQVLKEVRRWLSPHGIFIHSNWQFLNSPRLAARCLPWEKAGLHNDQVDPGDYLLDWRQGGVGLRYVHHFDLAELTRLAEQSGFRILKSFSSDGAGGNLGIYQMWRND